jgi:hypothetical protein
MWFSSENSMECGRNSTTEKSGYFTGAVRNENTNCKGDGSFREIVCFSVLTERFLDRALLCLLITYLLNLPLACL